MMTISEQQWEVLQGAIKKYGIIFVESMIGVWIIARESWYWKLDNVILLKLKEM